MQALMEDLNTTTQDLINFGGQAEDAVKRCNEDKTSARRVLNGET